VFFWIAGGIFVSNLFELNPAATAYRDSNEGHGSSSAVPKMASALDGLCR
jgi:hypothetical protein